MSNYIGALESFNPYISQIPVDAYIKVGMAKQGMRDAGVQKIQSVVDNISGLDVANQTDKDYLNNRVNELTTELNKHGNIDFSNAQYVKQMASLASPIQNDENIINAVASTQSIRSLQKSQQDALKGGKAENFSVDYENATYLQPYLNSKVAGQRFNGPTSTLSGSVTDIRKKYMDEVSKFKPDKYLTTSSADPVFKVQTENGLEVMDKNRISEYVLSTMSNDERELLKRSAWGDHRQLSNSQLIEKGRLMNLSKARQISDLATQYHNQSKLTSGEQQSYFNQLADSYKGDYDKQVGKINSEYGQINPETMSIAQRDQIYGDIGTTYFSQGIAGGISYQDVTMKEKENSSWKTVFEADNKKVSDALNNGQIFETPSFDENGNLTGFKVSDNPNKALYGKQPASGVGSAGSLGITDANGKLIETNVPLVAGPDDKMEWNLPTYNKIIGNLQTQESDITKSTYQFLREANIDTSDMFVTSYDKNSKGVIGQKTITSIKKGREEEVTKLVTALETAVNAELTSGDMTARVESGKSTTGNDAVDKQVQGLSLDMKSKFMPALQHLLDPKSGRGFIKILQQKLDYSNTKQSLINMTRKFAEIEYDGDKDRLNKIRNASDSDILNMGMDNSISGGWTYTERLDPKTNMVIVERGRGGGRDELGFSHKSEIETVSTKPATNKDVERLKYIQPSNFNIVDPNYHIIKSNSSFSLYKDGFIDKFNKYLHDNISARTENMYSTVMSNMMGKMGDAAKKQLMTSVLEQNGIPADESTLSNSNFTIGGYDNNNPDNPLDKTPKLRLNYQIKDENGKAQNKTVDVNMTALINANMGKSYMGADKQMHKHPFVDLFDAFQYMPQATAVMMDPYHGSRLNDKVENWPIVSDNKGNKALKYRVVWTGDDIDPKMVAANDNIKDNLSSGQAYIEVFVPGKGKVLVKSPSGNPQSFSHPAMAIKFLHDTFELSSETDLNKFYEYLSK